MIQCAAPLWTLSVQEFGALTRADSCSVKDMQRLPCRAPALFCEQDGLLPLTYEPLRARLRLGQWNMLTWHLGYLLSGGSRRSLLVQRLVLLEST